MKKTLFLFLLVLLIPTTALAATEGPNNPDTVTNVSAGDASWSSLNDAKTQDDSPASAATVSNSDTTDYLQTTNFGFSIPSGAIIDGITVDVDRHAGGISDASDEAVRIVKSGTIGSTDKSDGGNWDGTGDSDTYTTYGGASDLWGETWTVSDINASNFGFALRVVTPTAGTLLVDHVRITVTYTAGGGGDVPEMSTWLMVLLLGGCGAILYRKRDILFGHA